MRDVTYLHENGGLSAQALPNADVIGMPITISQILLITWNRISPGAFPQLINIDMGDDPWFKWVNESKENYTELWNYAMDIVDEYYHRFGSKAINPYQHGSMRSLDRLAAVPPLPDVPMTPMPKTVEQGRAEVQEEWSQRQPPGAAGLKGHFIHYTVREAPEWLK